MQLLSANSEHLATGLSKVLKAKSGTNPVAILDNVHVKTIEGGMILTCTNLEIAIQTGVQAQVKQWGKQFLLNPQACSVLMLLKAEKADIAFDIEGDTLTLTYANNHLKFAQEDHKHYPTMPVISHLVPGFSAGADTIEALKQSLPYVSKDYMRPALSGILFTNTTIAATDAHRLVQIEHEAGCKTEFSAIIRPSFVQALDIFAVDQDNVTMKVSQTHISAHDNNTLIIATLIDGKFPNTQQVIPTDNPNIVTFNREQLIKNIRLATVLSAKSDRRLILDMLPGSYTMTGSDPDYLHEINLKADCTASGKHGFDNLRIAFNGAFLLHVLDNIDTEQVTLLMDTATTAVIIHNAKTLYLIMPLMIFAKDEKENKAA